MTTSAWPPGLPQDNRQKDIFITAPILVVFSTIFVVLRLGVSIRNKKYTLLSDHLLLLGTILNIAANIIVYKSAIAGQGMHIWDPAMTPEKFTDFRRWIWWTELLTVYAMAAVKASVCAYLYRLNFSEFFKILIWISLVVHIVINFIVPSVVLFAECRPISKHWDTFIPGYCWGDKPKVITGYMNSSANILTDLFYTSAPLVYIHRVHLPKRTLWGVRAVFLLALITTVLSAMKLVEMKALNASPDRAYKAVNLSIYFMAEVSAGTFTACLPPLRKTFENLLKRILPDSFLGTSQEQRSYSLPTYASQLNRTERSKPPHERDDESETAILPSQQNVDKDNKGGIVRTTQVSISDALPEQPKADQWVQYIVS